MKNPEKFFGPVPTNTAAAVMLTLMQIVGGCNKATQAVIHEPGIERDGNTMAHIENSKTGSPAPDFSLPMVENPWGNADNGQGPVTVGTCTDVINPWGNEAICNPWEK